MPDDAVLRPARRVGGEFCVDTPLRQRQLQLGILCTVLSHKSVNCLAYFAASVPPPRVCAVRRVPAGLCRFVRSGRERAKP